MTTIPTDLIAWHPLIKDLPRWAENSPEMESLILDIKERGIDQPLIVCELAQPSASGAAYLLLDGRHRHRGAIGAQLPEVPVIVRPEAHAQDVILNSLCQRRHMTKGALAYLSYPVASSGARKGAGRPKKLPTESAISAATICAKLNFSRDVWEQAANLHETFAHRPDLREEYEPRILAGEIGLGACIAGIAGKEATDGKKRQDRAPQDLIYASINDFRTRFQRWEKIEPQFRKVIANETADTVLALPEEVQASIFRALIAARKTA